MENLPTNAADLIVIAVILVSGLLALSRGLVREILSVAGWIGAIFITLYAFPYVQPYAREIISIKILADGTAGASIFIITLIFLSLISHYLSRHVQESALGPVDRSLGFLFGILRGGVILCAAYLLVAWIIPKTEQPQWLRGARTMPLIEKGAKLLLDVVPEDMIQKGGKTAEEIQKNVDDAVESESQELFKQLTSPKPESTGSPEGDPKPGYGNEDRETLDRLFETNTER